MTTSNNINVGLHAALVRTANLVADSMKNKLSSGYPSGDEKYGWIPIQDTIVIGQVQQSSTSQSIQITLGGEKAPYAAAFEYGSGTWATVGPAGVYPIAARPGTPNLVFWWKKAGKWFIGPALPIGHPGVEKKPYIKPSIDENREEIKSLLKKEFKVGILLGGRRVQVINVGS